jgi:hypothetical protein
MEPLSISDEDYNNIVAEAQSVIADSRLKLSSVAVTSSDQSVIDAVIAVFGNGSVNNGIVTITYDMFCQTLQLLATTGKYKAEEYI